MRRCILIVSITNNTYYIKVKNLLEEKFKMTAINNLAKKYMRFEM